MDVLISIESTRMLFDHITRLMQKILSYLELGRFVKKYNILTYFLLPKLDFKLKVYILKTITIYHYM